MSAEGLYPLSGQNGVAIPLDIVKPVSLCPYTLAAGVANTIAIPPGFIVAYVYATANCILRLSAIALPAALVTNTEYPGAIFIPADCPFTLNLVPGAAQLLGLGTGVLYISAVEQWGSTMQDQQARIG